jgi:hypothetical protein
MNIAIIDDQSNERLTVRNLLLEYFTTKNICHIANPIFYEYSSGEEFLQIFQQDNFR